MPRGLDRRSTAGSSTLRCGAEVSRNQNIDDGVPVPPPVLDAVRRRDRFETTTLQRRRDGEVDLRVRAYVQDCIGVVGGSDDARPALSAPEMHHLPADDGPSFGHVDAQIHECVPASFLRVGSARHLDDLLSHLGPFLRGDWSLAAVHAGRRLRGRRSRSAAVCARVSPSARCGGSHSLRLGRARACGRR